MKTIISIFKKMVLQTNRNCIAIVFVMAFSALNTVTAQKQPLPFITTWQTASREAPDTRHIIFPGWGRNYTIFWTGRVGGRTVYGQLVGNGATRIDFPAPGTYQVRVGPGSGTFHRFRMYESESKKLLRVDQWGSVAWSSMGSAFKNCYNMNVVATDIPNLSQVIDMSSMFENCLVLTGNVTFNNWNTGNVRTMKSLFEGAKLFNQPIWNWNTGNVTDMSRLFLLAWNFNQEIGNWNTSRVTNMSNMFYATGFFNQPIGNWNTANVTDMSYMFNSAVAFNQPIGNWNTANVLTMKGMFDSAQAFNQAIGSWNTSNVKNMSSMFYFSKVFNQPLAGWDTGNVTDMSVMFCHNYVFNQPIGNWNTQNVTSMYLMFSMTKAFNQPIGGWNTGKVTDMSKMFYGLPLFNQPIGSWNTASVKNMSYMFINASAFNQPIGNWNTSAVTDMSHMFDHATSFNQPVGNWNTAAVADMAYMFLSAPSFNQPLGNWQVGNVKSMYQMLDSTAMSTDNYDQMFISWERQILQRGVVLGAATLTYCKGATFRNLIVYRYGWVILGDRNDCSNCTGCRMGANEIAASPEESNLAEVSKSEMESSPGLAYPNPTSDRLFINNEGGNINSISIFDANGRIVLNQNVTNGSQNREEISTTRFPSGVYMLSTFQKDGTRKSQKIVISK